MSHGHARTTVHGRKLIVQRWQNGWKKAHIAAAMGISRRCVRTRIGRHQTEGAAGLTDRSSRPHTSPRRTAVEVEERIVELRRRERRGPAWSAPSWACRPAPSRGCWCAPDYRGWPHSTR